jgi:hypothetical protein
MLAPILFAAALAVADSTQVYDGLGNHTKVDVPRIDTVATVDGILNESAWAHAARLTGFSQYQPVDGRPAEEPTEVLVWYAPDAIWFGIKAKELHGSVVRATRAVIVGVASRTSPRRMSCRPSRVRDCGRRFALARPAGAHVSWNAVC